MCSVGIKTETVSIFKSLDSLFHFRRLRSAVSSLEVFTRPSLLSGSCLGLSGPVLVPELKRCFPGFRSGGRLIAGHQFSEQRVLMVLIQPPAQSTCLRHAAGSSLVQTFLVHPDDAESCFWAHQRSRIKLCLAAVSPPFVVPVWTLLMWLQQRCKCDRLINYKWTHFLLMPVYNRARTLAGRWSRCCLKQREARTNRCLQSGKKEKDQHNNYANLRRNNYGWIHYL